MVILQYESDYLMNLLIPFISLLGGVPQYKRMVASAYNPGFKGCISHVKTSATRGAIDLFKDRISGIDVTNTE